MKSHAEKNCFPCRALHTKCKCLILKCTNCCYYKMYDDSLMIVYRIDCILQIAVYSKCTFRLGAKQFYIILSGTRGLIKVHGGRKLQLYPKQYGVLINLTAKYWYLLILKQKQTRNLT